MLDSREQPESAISPDNFGLQKDYSVGAAAKYACAANNAMVEVRGILFSYNIPHRNAYRGAYMIVICGKVSQHILHPHLPRIRTHRDRWSVRRLEDPSLLTSCQCPRPRRRCISRGMWREHVAWVVCGWQGRVVPQGQPWRGVESQVDVAGVEEQVVGPYS